MWHAAGFQARFSFFSNSAFRDFLLYNRMPKYFVLGADPGADPKAYASLHNPRTDKLANPPPPHSSIQGLWVSSQIAFVVFRSNHGSRNFLAFCFNLASYLYPFVHTLSIIGWFFFLELPAHLFQQKYHLFSSATGAISRSMYHSEAFLFWSGERPNKNSSKMIQDSLNAPDCALRVILFPYPNR